MKHNPRLFFSFRSPFSWITVERLQQAVPEVHSLVEFIPYWEPDVDMQTALKQRGAEIHYTPMSKAKHLYILQDTKRLAEKLGLRLTWPVDISPCWDLPHLGWLKARRLGLGAPFYTALVEARWQRGENICNPEVIRLLATSVGIDGDLIVSAPDDPGIRSEGVDCLFDAYQDDIFGVPYLRVGPHRFWGVDRLDWFLSVFHPTFNADGSQPATGPMQDRANAGLPHPPSAVTVPGALEGIPAEVQAAVSRYDTDTAGGCG